MEKNRYWDFALGVCLAATLQTNMRVTDGVGFGEIGLFFCLIYAALLLGWRKKQPNFPKRLIVLLLPPTYVFVFMLPTTILNIALGTNGTTIRDWFAYALSALMILAISLKPGRIETIATSCIFATLLFTCLQFVLGGDTGWYSARFTGGAKNPNQLALGVVCNLFLLLGFGQKKIRYVIAALMLMIFGLLTLSDAFLAFIAATLGMWLAARIIPYKNWIIASVPALTIALVLFLCMPDSTGSQLLDIWRTADQGDGRTTLYTNGLTAWLHSPFSIVFGNGAGAFSGLGGAFQGSESHNSLIDNLAIGGVLGTGAMYAALLHCMWLAYRSNRRWPLAVAFGLFCFSMFHLVIRQPIFWFTIVALLDVVSRPNTPGLTERSQQAVGPSISTRASESSAEGEEPR